MSEETREAPPEAPAAEKASAAPARKDAPPVVLIAVVVAALGAGAALGGLLLAPRLIHARQAATLARMDPHAQSKKKDKKGGKHEKKGEAGRATVYKLDNIIVNPADSQGQRFLMCTVAFESDDSRTLDTLREHEIELRDHVVNMLARQSLDRLTAQSARDSLRAELRQAVLPVLGDEAEDVDLKVYLPQFVVQ